MNIPKENHVSFKSEHFSNLNNSQESNGEELASWLSQNFKAFGIEINSIQKNDFSTTINIESENCKTQVICAADPEEINYWQLQFSSSQGFLSKMFKGSSNSENTINKLKESFLSSISNNNEFTEIEWWTP